ncbi:MAG: transposase [Burkholderiaceae bacterium]
MHSFLGVDVSKAKLDVALLLSSDKFKSKVFANDPQGFAALLKWLNDQLPAGGVELHVCMEATGSYHRRWLALHDQGLKCPWSTRCGSSASLKPQGCAIRPTPRTPSARRGSASRKP